MITDNGIEIDGQVFGIEQSIQMEHYSALFDREELTVAGEKTDPRGKFSYPFKMIATPELLAALGNPHLLSVANAPNTVDDVVLYSDGVRIDKGQLLINRMVRNLNNRVVELELLFFYEEATLVDAIGEKMVNELAMNGIINIDGDTFDDLPLEEELRQFGATPSHARIWWGQSADEWPASHQHLTIQFFDHRISTNTTTFTNPFDWSYGNPLTFRRQTSYYAEQITKGVTLPGHDYFRFPMMIVEDEDLGHCILNAWKSADNEMARRSEVNFFRERDVSGPVGVDHYQTNGKQHYDINSYITPMYYYHQVLRHIFSEAGYTLKGKLLENPHFLKKVCVNAQSITKREVIQFTGGLHPDDMKWISELPTEINPANHLPKISQIDFVRNFLLEYCCVLKVQGKEVTIVHSDLTKVGQELEEKSVNPEIVGEYQKDRGVRVYYEFPDYPNYEKQKAWDRLYEPVAETIDGTGAPATGHYIVKRNGIITALPDATGNAVMNHIHYYTGKAKEYGIQMVPVCARKQFYFIRDERPALIESNDVFLPFTQSRLGRYADKIVKYNKTLYFEYDGFNDHYIGLEFYEQELVQETEYMAGDDLNALGFYYGLMGTYALYTDGLTYPYMSFHNYQPGPNTKIGDWNLSLVGSEGLIAYWWKDFAKIFEQNRKFIMQVNTDYYTIRNHQFINATVFQGQRFYVSNIKMELPLKKWPKFEMYKL